MLLTPEKAEKSKTSQQHAEDIAYTINHSLYCTLTDFLNPPINAATDNWLRWLIPGCGHDHSQDGGHHHAHGAACSHHHHEASAGTKWKRVKRETRQDFSKNQDGGHHHAHGPACSHHHHEPPTGTRWERVKQATRQAFGKERFIQYAKGEFIGDFGAVPLTIGVQRHFPNFMNGLRNLSEPVMRPLFKWGVEHDNIKWARKNNVAVDSQEYKDHAAKVYEYEMGHFPQAIVWTGFSLGLNTAYQMHADKSPIPFNRKLLLKSTSVLSGVLVTAGVVVAARALMPNKMHEFDKWTSKKAILPATRAVGKVFGVKEEDIERMVEKHDQLKGTNWTQRVSNTPQEAIQR